MYVLDLILAVGFALSERFVIKRKDRKNIIP